MNTVLTQFDSPNYTPQAQVPSVFGAPRTIDSITIHWWGDPNTNPTFEGVVAWLCNPRSVASAHDVVTGTGARVAILVEYMNAAWHAGDAVGNRSSLGIECDPRARDEDYTAVAQDVADTWKWLGRIVPLRPHNSWRATQCPGVYNLDRIYSMALAIYNGAEPAQNANDDQIRALYLEILERPADDGAITHYRNYSVDFVRQDLLQSQERKDLEAKKAKEYAKNEWVRNLNPYTIGDTDFSETVKLIVLPAQGLMRYNLENGQLFNSDVIPKGTVVDIVAKTSVGGKDYLISRYSKNSGQAVGLPADELGIPAVPPSQEKPEWLANLNDIADKDMWTRSATPVLNVADGSVVNTLPINTKVRITHATQIVGKDLLVIENTQTVIEVVYLSDEPIKDPDTDIETPKPGEPVDPIVPTQPDEPKPPVKQGAFARFVSWILKRLSELAEYLENRKKGK